MTEDFGLARDGHDAMGFYYFYLLAFPHEIASARVRVELANDAAAVLVAQELSGGQRRIEIWHDDGRRVTPPSIIDGFPAASKDLLARIAQGIPPRPTLPVSTFLGRPFPAGPAVPMSIAV